MDDEKAKIRRNLVGFCSVYLAFDYLDLPLSQLAGNILAIKGNLAIPDIKFLVLSSIVLVYFMFRWFTSTENKDDWKLLRDELRSYSHRRVVGWVEERARTQKFDKHFAVHPPNVVGYAGWLNEWKSRLGGDAIVRANVGDSKRINWFAGVFQLEISLISRTDPTFQNGSPTHQVNFAVDIPARTCAWVLCMGLRASIAQQTFWNVFPPAFLFALVFVRLIMRWMTL